MKVASGRQFKWHSFNCKIMEKMQSFSYLPQPVVAARNGLSQFQQDGSTFYHPKSAAWVSFDVPHLRNLLLCSQAEVVAYYFLNLSCSLLFVHFIFE